MDQERQSQVGEEPGIIRICRYCGSRESNCVCPSTELGGHDPRFARDVRFVRPDGEGTFEPSERLLQLFESLMNLAERPHCRPVVGSKLQRPVKAGGGAAKAPSREPPRLQPPPYTIFTNPELTVG